MTSYQNISATASGVDVGRNGGVRNLAANHPGRNNDIIIDVENPLIGRAPAHVEAEVRAFAVTYRLMDILPLLLTGAKISMNPEEFQNVAGLTTEELEALEREGSMTFWDQTKELRTTIFTCAIAAIVQGWDQSSINGANLRWPRDFCLRVGSPNGSATNKDLWIFALINAAPFIFGALCGSWLCDPFSFKGGRRFGIFFAGVFCLFSTIGSAISQTWQQLLICRVLLGIGMGAKASIVPVYAAEVAPAHIRGRLVMNWQVYDALGSFLGFSANLAFNNIKRLSWRLQLAAPCLPAIPLLCLIYTCPESARFLIKKGKFRKAYKSLLYLNETPLQAARELYLIHAQNEAENLSYNLSIGEQATSRQRQALPQSVSDISTTNDSTEGVGTELEEISISEREVNGSTDADEPDATNRGSVNKLILWKDLKEFYEVPGFWRRFKQLFTVQRMSSSLIAAVVLMVAQQLCGINVIAFYSSTLFSSANSTLFSSGDCTVFSSKDSTLFGSANCTFFSSGNPTLLNSKNCILHSTSNSLLSSGDCTLFSPGNSTLLSSGNCTLFDYEECILFSSGNSLFSSGNCTLLSSEITTDPSKETDALWLGWGFGLTNFLFAFPAYSIIDKGGRRPLLLTTIPILAITLLGASMSFKIPEENKAHNSVISVFIILFTMFYSFGLGPVPFTYSAEVFPQGNREVGMSVAVFCNLLGAGILSLTVPFIKHNLHSSGLLGLFAGLNLSAWVLVFFLVYETKQATLEEMRKIFSVTTRDYVKYQFFEGLPWIYRYVRTLGRTPRKAPPYRLRRAQREGGFY